MNWDSERMRRQGLHISIMIISLKLMKNTQLYHLPTAIPPLNGGTCIFIQKIYLQTNWMQN